MIGFLQQNYPGSLPTRRDAVTVSSGSSPEKLPST
jgi:hypothetical protein